MKGKKKSFAMTAILIAILVISICHYSMYVSRQFYHESTENLMSTYEQVDKTFMMFAQRNWNVLTDWSSYLKSLSEEDNPEEKWRDFVEERESWQYSDFYVFNEECQYWTVDGRQGTAEHVRNAFEQLYSEGAPIVSSYTASSGVRRVLFAVPTEPITLNNVTYTALAVTYDNSVMQDMIGGRAYGGASDCYIIYSNGDVLLSVEPKTEITTKIDNLFDFLEMHAESYDNKYMEQMKRNVPNQASGSVKYQYEGTDYYLVYQPVGIKDWSIVGIVERDAVDSGMRSVQQMTIILISVLMTCIGCGVIAFIIQSARNRVKQEQMQREELARRKELTEQMFEGMAQIVDRFAVCDLKNNTYEYHERRGTPLYPEQGSYDDLVQLISDLYTYGHEMGDKVLKEVARRLQTCIRSHDYAFRMGGDEFTLVINGNMNEELCAKRIERIKQEIGAPYYIDGQTISIGTSCGSAVYPDDGDDVQTIQNLADQRMYADKEINHAQR